MTSQNTPNYDYSTGSPRPHHRLYLDDGNFVMQVENAIFKVHRSFLVQQSKVFKEMFDAPKEGAVSKDGTDEVPVVLEGESAIGWEVLFNGIYVREPMSVGSQLYTLPQLMSLLGIAHKYCMEAVERNTLLRIRAHTTPDSYVSRIVASRIVDSKELYNEGVQGLINTRTKINLEQAKQIGMDAVHAILMSMYF